jgi:type I restriction enzyme S subunit
MSIQQLAVSDHDVVRSSGHTRPPDYKHSEIGLLPKDWEAVRIGDLGTVTTGSTPPTSDASLYGDQYPFVSPLDLGERKYIRTTEKMLSNRGFELCRQLPSGTVLFVCIGSTIGKCGIAASTLATNQQINAVQAHNAPSEFIYYALCHAARRIQSQAGTQAVPIVNKAHFAETFVALPPTSAEQIAIAQALADADEHIESLERLTAKKRNLKPAAMQQLLNGKKRLPGFEGEWVTKRLGEIGEAVAGLTYAPSDVCGEGGTLVLRASNVEGGTLTYDDNVYVSMDLPERVFVQEGDILICVRNGSRNLIGKCAQIDKFAQNAGHVFGAFMAVFRSNYNDFVYHHFQSGQIKKQIHEHLGATINQITNKSLNAFEIPFPSRDEQRAIASVLSDIDSDIAAIEASIAKARRVKIGMMQELLTGKTRLV